MSALLEMPQGARVGMIDDDPAAMRALSYQLQDADLTPVAISLAGSPDVDEVIAAIVENECAAAICDHRLNGSGHARFDGAQLACQSNLSRQIPCVLLSAWTSEDESTSIRRWRHGIPRVLNKRGRTTKDLSEALTVTKLEISGDRPLERRAFRTAIEVARVSYEAECPTVCVYVPAWNPDAQVVIPLDLFPDSVRSHPPREFLGSQFIADVNYYAPNEGELFFQNIRQASPVPESWMPA